MNKNKILVNVASSTYALEGFINLDDHIFLSFMWLYRRFKFLIPVKYHNMFLSFLKAQEIGVLIKHDCRKPLPFKSNSVDHIPCSHFLEHVFPDEVDQILKDYKRVLKVGGTLHIILPDIQFQVNNYLKKKKDGDSFAADEFIANTYLTRKKNYQSFKLHLLNLFNKTGHKHHWMYDKESISRRIQDANFLILPKNNTPSESFRKNDNSVHVIAVKQ